MLETGHTKLFVPPHLRVLHVSKDPQHSCKRTASNVVGVGRTAEHVSKLRQLLPEITLFENLTFGPSDGENLKKSFCTDCC